MKKTEKIKVGISIGDTNGIGIEVVLKTFSDNRMLDFCTPILFGSSKLISLHKKALNLNVPINGISNFNQVIEHKINLFNVWKEDVSVDFGQMDKTAGKYAFLSLSKAVESLKDESIDVLVTAPINKENIQSDDFNFQGHTEYLSSELNGEELMILMTDKLRVGLITGHIPIQDVAKTITPELIEKKVTVFYDSLIKDFNISKPKIY